jgi:hypothetical protein
MRKLPALLVLLLFAYPSFAQTQNSIVFWKTIVGLITTPGSSNLNPIGNIPSGGFPWVTTGGDAFVNLSNGDVHFRVEGLSVVGTSNIGQPSIFTNVTGTVVCDPGGAAQQNFDTGPVPISPQGDAEFVGVLNSAPGASCFNPAFLIRRGAALDLTGAWVASGIVRTMSH